MDGRGICRDNEEYAGHRLLPEIPIECRLVGPDRQAVEGAGASGIVGALSGDV